VLYVCMSWAIAGEKVPCRPCAGVPDKEPDEEVPIEANFRWSSARNVNGMRLPAASSAITRKVTPDSET